MEEEWDPARKDFSFDQARMVHMVSSPSRNPSDRPSHDAPWTVAGRKAEDLRKAQTSVVPDQ
ncbi:hypothetical protein FRC08_013808 [Ceratobasidium sp. 394]|nr:hypothetical protein FRC08_013808 [Ceratobasidium sp. 394]